MNASPINVHVNTFTFEELTKAGTNISDTVTIKIIPNVTLMKVVLMNW